MLRIFKSKGFILMLVTVLIFVIMGVSGRQNSYLNKIGNVISVPLAPLQRAISAASGSIEGVLSFFRDIKAIRQENEELKAEIDKLRKETVELEEYRGKIKELKDALNLKDQLSEYDSIGANIIAKDAGNWYKMFTVDRGSRDGIQSRSPIISSKGLVGMIKQSDMFSSKAQSIIDPDSVVSGRLIRTRDTVIVRGDLTLKDKGLCKMNYIPADVDIMVGDVVETSGLGGIYPKGILIGKVLEVRKTGSELSKYAIIEPAVDFKRLEEIIVLRSRINNVKPDSEER